MRKIPSCKILGFDEDLSEDEAGSTKKGMSKHKVKRKKTKSAKVKFDMVPRGPSNTGNIEDNMASRQSSTSALAPTRKKKIKNVISRGMFERKIT